MTTTDNAAPLGSEDTLEVAGILGISPDDAAEMSVAEISAAFAGLKIQEDDRTVNADLLLDSSRIA
jgi:hypothetical protein